MLKKILDKILRPIFLLMAFILHKKVFSKYKNINKGKNVAIIATGPSLKDFKPLENVSYIGVNRAFELDKIKFDYLFLQDYTHPTPEYIDNFIKYDAKKFLGILTKKAGPNTVIPKKYTKGKNIETYRTFHPKENRGFTIDISSLPLGDYYSIMFPALQFALWTHPKKIYLIGCDCTTNGYYTGNSNKLAVNLVLEGWAKMKDFIDKNYPDIEIISINPVGLKGIFKDEYQNMN